MFQLEFAILTTVLLFTIYLLISGFATSNTNSASKRVIEYEKSFKKSSEKDKQESILIRFWDPLILFFEKYVQMVVPTMDRKAIKVKLIQGGKGYLTPESYFASKMAAAVLTACFYALVSNMFHIFNIAALVLFLIVGFFVPDIDLAEKTGKRKERIKGEFLQFLSLSDSMIKSNYTPDEAFTRIATELPSVFGGEILAMYEEIEKTNRRRKDAYRDLSDRCGVPEVDAFVNALVMQDTMGNSLSDSLGSLKNELRSKEESAIASNLAKIKTRLSGPTMLSMLSFLILLAAGIGITISGFVTGLQL